MAQVNPAGALLFTDFLADAQDRLWHTSEVLAGAAFPAASWGDAVL
jgi:hypothetical protein